MDQQIQHSSHPHPLELKDSRRLNIAPCSACRLRSTGWMYACIPCNFTLHYACASKPPSLHRQSHPCEIHIDGHPGEIHIDRRPGETHIHVYPPNQTRRFSCDVCHRMGSNHCSYRGNRCNFDFHRPGQMNNQGYMPSQSQINGTAISGNTLIDAFRVGQQVGQSLQSWMGDDSDDGN